MSWWPIPLVGVCSAFYCSFLHKISDQALCFSHCTGFHSWFFNSFFLKVLCWVDCVTKWNRCSIASRVGICVWIGLTWSGKTSGIHDLPWGRKLVDRWVCLVGFTYFSEHFFSHLSLLVFSPIQHWTHMMCDFFLSNGISKILKWPLNSAFSHPEGSLVLRCWDNPGRYQCTYT